MEETREVKDKSNSANRNTKTMYELYLETPTLYYLFKTVAICFVVMYTSLRFKKWVLFLTVSNSLCYLLTISYNNFEEFGFCSFKAILINYLIFSCLAYYDRSCYLRIFYNFLKNEHPKVELEAWTSKWEEDFLQEKKRLEVALRPKYENYFLNKQQGLVHIGSTSIKKIKLAKPIHDMGLYWNTNSPLPQSLFDDLDELGYFYIGPNFASPDCYDHWFFNKNTDFKQGFDIHLTQPGDHKWLDDTITFCEYLSENEEARKKYEDVKRENESKDIGTYSMNKAKTVVSLRGEAAEWKKKKN